MSINLDAIQERADAATEGPWQVNDLRDREDGNRDCIWVDVANGRTYMTVAELTEDTGLEIVWTLADAEFIANARTDVPALIALVREQQARIEALTVPAPCQRCGSSYGKHDECGPPYPVRAALTATDAA